MSVLYVKVGDETAMFDHSFTIGRDNARVTNDVSLDDMQVSNLHCAFTQDDEGWYVQDMGSTNGTYLNDVEEDGRFTYAKTARVWEPVLLRRGDKVRIGQTVLICVPA